MNFTGTITKIKQVRSGKTDKGEWANAEFEVTESNPQNEKYPQIGFFDYFKNGEHVKYAKEFENNFKVGDEVDVEFNLGKTLYTKKDGTEGEFYKTSAWKVTKTSNSSSETPQPFKEVGDDYNEIEDEDNGLPF